MAKKITDLAADPAEQTPVEILAPTEPVTMAAPPPPAECTSLGDYLQSRSVTDSRVELLSAFYGDCTARGLISTTSSEFDAAFLRFATSPI